MQCSLDTVISKPIKKPSYFEIDKDNLNIKVASSMKQDFYENTRKAMDDSCVETVADGEVLCVVYNIEMDIQTTLLDLIVHSCNTIIMQKYI